MLFTVLVYTNHTYRSLISAEKMLSMFWCIILEKNCDHGVLAFLSLFGSLLQRKEVVVFRGLILHFMTGLSKIPPLGLEKNIDIEFDMSSTCLQSRLLLKHVVLCWEFQPLIRILRPSMEKFWKRLSYVVCNFEHLSLMLTYLFTDVLCLIWITTVKCSERNFMHYDLNYRMVQQFEKRASKWL